MILQPPPVKTTRRIYDALAASYDWFSSYEARAKQRALELLALAPGQRVLNVGLGTGKEHLLIQQAIAPGTAFGVDISPKMLQTAYLRTGAPLCEADGGALPFAPATFDRLFCAYVLDLVNVADLPDWLAGFRRMLKPGGGAVIVYLTEGVDASSRMVVGLWKAAYAVSPIACAGCRPLQLADLAEKTGFHLIERHVVTQMGVPSEILSLEC